MEKTISLKEMIKILKKRWKLITLLTLFTSLCGGLISYLVLTPVFQASTQILVNQKEYENRLDVSQLRSNVELINTYSVIIKSPVILDKVIEDLDLRLSLEQLNKNITINSPVNSQVFTLTVEDQNPGKAVEIANAISETFQKEIPGIMNVNNVNILAKADLGENPIPEKPNALLNIAIATAGGLMSGIGLALLLEFMDTTIKNEQDVVEHLGLPALGSIVHLPKTRRRRKDDSKVKNMGGETFEA